MLQTKILSHPGRSAWSSLDSHSTFLGAPGHVPAPSPFHLPHRCHPLSSAPPHSPRHALTWGALCPRESLLLAFCAPKQQCPESSPGSRWLCPFLYCFSSKIAYRLPPSQTPDAITRVLHAWGDARHRAPKEKQGKMQKSWAA